MFSNGSGKNDRDVNARLAAANADDAGTKIGSSKYASKFALIK